MAQEKRDNRVIIYGEDVRKALLSGAEAVYNAVTTTYGPKGRNVLLEKITGRPILTRDGVTVAKDVYFSDRAKNMAAQLIIEASQTTNRVAGDGTTATVALTYHLIKKAVELVGSGVNPMEVRATIQKDCTTLIEELNNYRTEVKKGQLIQVATVSAGDAGLGRLIAEAVERVGKDGGLITEKSFISGVEREYIDGYYLQQGFNGLTAGKKELENCLVVTTARKISSNADFLELIQKIDVAVNGSKRPEEREKLRIAFIGAVDGQARDSIIANINQGALDAVIIDTPSTGDMGVHYLEDIAIYTGGKILATGDNIGNYDETYIGHADRVVCTQYNSSIFGGQSDEAELQKRLAELQERADTEESDALTEKIRDRISKLRGSIAKFKIGGATETEKEELEYRIEDAIQATRAAHAHGVVAGGATTLLRLSKADISPMYSAAIQEVFKKLMSNANLSGDVKMHQVLEADYPMGINLRGKDELVDMIEAGVLDPAKVVSEIIDNASSIAGNAITIESMILFEDREPIK